MEKTIINLEQIEAEQAAANKIIEDQKENLSLEDKVKYDAVNKACEILTDAKVAFYMFPMLRHFDSGTEEAMQYNNLFDLRQEKDGKLSTDSYNMLQDTNESLIKSFCNLLFSILKKDNQDQTWNNLFKLIGETSNKHNAKLKEILINKQK